MAYRALICDYDGTIAAQGKVEPPVVRVLEQVRASGRKLILATGRVLPDLLSIFAELKMFHAVVAENGAVLYRTDTRETELLCKPPSLDFLAELNRQAIRPLYLGEVMVATWRPKDVEVAEIIRMMKLPLEITFNKSSVMVLPTGVTKGSGLKTAFEYLELTSEEVVGVGDGENDIDLLKMCGCGVALANAVPILQEVATFVTQERNGAGVIELSERLLANKLPSAKPDKVTSHGQTKTA
jgi:hydroxymethylpyrimidine pyrophosphatase-like HAD family hydrolase